MKKTISIHLGGILFHIEEDGYELLNRYLVSVRNYFSQYEDSQEIINDIESRIAELFTAQLAAGFYQALSLENVQEVIARMGSVADFAAAETDNENNTTTSQETKVKEDIERPHKIFLDKESKLIGGVCAGLANYFGIDAVWVRLLFIATFFGISYVPEFTMIISLLYVALWVGLPISQEQQQQTIRRLYRDEDNKVLAGVASGLATFWKIDALLLRIIFIALIFAGGTGIFVYLVLWAITPVARTVTEKMQMKGEKIDLFNIESFIQEKLKNNGIDEKESTLAKVILFPFRVLAVLFDFLGKLLKPITVFTIETARVIAGLILMFIGGVCSFVCLLMSFIYLGWSSDYDMVIDDIAYRIPVAMLQQELPIYTFLAANLAVFIPCLLIGLVGLALVIHRNFFHWKFNIAVFSVWVIAVLFASVGAISIASHFKKSEEVVKEIPIVYRYKKLLLDMNPVQTENGLSVPLTIIPSSDSTQCVLEYQFTGYGATYAEATESATQLDYNFVQQDSVLLFDDYATFAKGAKYRGQQLRLELKVPKNKPFMMTPKLVRILENTLTPAGYSTKDVSNDVLWQFNQAGVLECLNCEK